MNRVPFDGVGINFPSLRMGCLCAIDQPFLKHF